MFASAVGKLLCSGLVEPIGGGVIQVVAVGQLDVLGSFDDKGPRFLSQLATINLSSLRSSWSALS
jgi:hypothetical protein